LAVDSIRRAAFPVDEVPAGNKLGCAETWMDLVAAVRIFGTTKAEISRVAARAP
jgi:hypothetical protein